MIIGLQIPSFKYPGGTPASRPILKEIVTTAAGAGFSSLWVMDHYYQIKGLFGEAYTDPMMESYTTLGYFAGLTEKVSLGVMVTGVIYRHPSVLLKMVNTLDILSGGRAYLGIGAAWYEEEARGFGIPYPSTSVRFEQLEAPTTLVQRLVPPALTEVSGYGPMKTDIRLYAYRERVLGVTARLYRGQVTNLRTAGGGFAAVRIG